MVKVQPFQYQAVVIGASAGGLKVLAEVCGALPKGFALPILVVQHLHPQSRYSIQLRNYCVGLQLKNKEADNRELPVPGTIYFAPPNYHLLVEADYSLALSVDEKVNMSRPSIDVLFESAAEAYGAGLIGIILSGASGDGAAGLKQIKRAGGLTIAQNPVTAEAKIMPAAAIATGAVDHVLEPREIASLLLRIVQRGEAGC
ncbi:MAG: chemotaxis protein CheB [Deltaproteobacteria bacterium]|nr:chemotaxis protein CheB [Deltaproteobacteria bacterium]